MFHSLILESLGLRAEIGKCSGVSLGSAPSLLSYAARLQYIP